MSKIDSWVGFIKNIDISHVSVVTLDIVISKHMVNSSVSF
jgi:hypothetical protein